MKGKLRRECESEMGMEIKLVAFLYDEKEYAEALVEHLLLRFHWGIVLCDALEEEVEDADALPKRQTERKRITAASLRLDAVAGEVFHLSRGKVQALIGAEKAAVNWNTVTSTSHLLKEGDMVSLRGFGRFRVGEVGGKTKKDRVGLEIERYI